MAGIEEFYLISTKDEKAQSYLENNVLKFPSPFEPEDIWQTGRYAGYYAVPKGQIDDDELDWLDENSIVYYSISFNESNQVIGGNLPKNP